jgi:hypothetical protein
MHYSINLDIKAEIDKLGHKVAKFGISHNTGQTYHSLFFVDLKPAPTNKSIFDVEYLNQCKIKFEPPRHRREIAKCTNCQRYGHKKRLPFTPALRQMPVII